MGFELRALCLLGMHCTAWAIPPAQVQTFLTVSWRGPTELSLDVLIEASGRKEGVSVFDKNKAFLKHNYELQLFILGSFYPTLFYL
jgi:hypothetical protein